MGAGIIRVASIQETKGWGEEPWPMPEEQRMYLEGTFPIDVRPRAVGKICTVDTVKLGHVLMRALATQSRVCFRCHFKGLGV